MTTALQVRAALNELRVISLTLPDLRDIWQETRDGDHVNSFIIEGSGVGSTGQAQSLLGATVTLPSDSIPFGFCHCGCGGKTEIAHKTDRSNGWTRGEPKRFLPKHHYRYHLKWKSIGPTHASNRDLTYNSWASMRERTRPTSKASRWYHDKGITVCERWESFDNFFADMGPRPLGTTLERCNSNGNYEPSNCRWATMREQSNNRKTNHRVTAGDVTFTIAEWSRRSGLGDSTIKHRLRTGWPAEAAVSLPVGSKRP